MVIQHCYVCGKIYGEKEPLEDKAVTSGICPACWPVTLIQLYGQIFGKALRRWTENNPPRR